MDEYIVDVECSANPKKNCAVILDYVSCDGYLDTKTIGVFSHFHEDHIWDITKCIGSYDVLLTHATTFNAIIALEPGLKYRTQWVPQQFDTEYYGDNIKIRLLKANHIPGSAQVYVESDGKSLLYSGDFNFPDMQIKQADYLVLDATHGDPSYDGHTDRTSVMNRLFDDVKQRTSSGKSVVIRTSGGTLQEIVRNFEMVQDYRIADGIPFVMSETQKKILFNIYAEDTKLFRNILDYDSKEFWNLIWKNKPCVIFTTAMILDYDLRSLYRIIIDRYRFVSEQTPIIPFSDKYGHGCRYNLAAHASIENIYSYVEAVNPKYVVTDYSRSKYAPQLAKMIRQKFPNIQAKHRPPH